MFNYKEWYEKNREKQLLWQKNYYKENKKSINFRHGKHLAQKRLDNGCKVGKKTIEKYDLKVE